MIIRVSFCIHSSIFCMFPSNINLHKGLLSLFLSVPSVSIPWTKYQCTKLERSSSSEDSSNPSTPHCILPLPKPSHWNEASLKQAFGPCLCVANLEGRCDGYPGIMLNHTRLDAKPRAASSTIQPVSPPFTQSLDQRP